jgi:hypothetical protein
MPNKKSLEEQKEQDMNELKLSFKQLDQKEVASFTFTNPKVFNPNYTSFVKRTSSTTSPELASRLAHFARPSKAI